MTKSSRRIKTEIVTKVVAVRAGNFSIGPFCTEFRCEQLCDDGVFQKSLKIWPVRAGSVRRFAPVRAGSVHAVRRFVPVRFVPVRRFVPFVPVRFVPVRFWRFRFGSWPPCHRVRKAPAMVIFTGFSMVNRGVGRFEAEPPNLFSDSRLPNLRIAAPTIRRFSFPIR